jgi:hypothetical protein
MLRSDFFRWYSVIASKILVATSLAVSAGMAPANAAPVTSQGTWWNGPNALQGRDQYGKPVAQDSPDAVFFYDPALNITWLRNANAGAGSIYDNADSINPSTTDGKMTWANANSWVSTLSVGGYAGWRLPTIVDTGTPGCDQSYSGTDCGHNVQTKSGNTVYSELAYLWYVELGNKAYYDTSGNPAQPGWGLSNTGNFMDLQGNDYWSSLEYAPDTSLVWVFFAFAGQQYQDSKNGLFYALAVRPGDVAASVPEPKSLALVLVGLAAAGVARRGKRL